MFNRLKELTKYAGLFTSFGTLICCAIPSTLVLLGFGASLASFLGEWPQLIWLSENKEWVFGASFLMLGLSYWSQKSSVCPIDKKEACEGFKRWANPIFIVTLIINIIGSFYAFVLPRIL